MNNNAPHEFLHHLQGHVVDIVDYSKYEFTNRFKGMALIIFGSVIGGFVPVFGLLFLMPLVEFLSQGQTSITVNGTVQNYDNPWVPALFSFAGFGMAFLIGAPGLICMIFGMKLLRRKGYWFAITKSGLFTYNSRGFKEFPWTEFTQQIELKNRGSRHTITLHRKPGISILPPASVAPQTDNKALFRADFIKFIDTKIVLYNVKEGTHYVNFLRNYIEGNQEENSSTNLAIQTSTAS